MVPLSNTCLLSLGKLKNWKYKQWRTHDPWRSVCNNFCTSDLFEWNNVAGKLTSIRQRLLQFTKRITCFKPHMYLCSELLDKKPYTVPMQSLPYNGLKEVDISTLVSALCRVVKWSCQVKIIHTSTGEFNYLHTKGYTWPLTVIQIHYPITGCMLCMQVVVNVILIPTNIFYYLIWHWKNSVPCYNIQLESDNTDCGL